MVVEEVNPQAQKVDLFHYHVLPFTTKKPVVFRDLTPITLDKTNTKILRSVTPKREYQERMGERLGLDIRFEVETECELYDRKTLLDTIQNYRFNPFIAVAFMGTETALRADRSPTARYHQYTLVHSPQTSTTKQLKADIKVSAAVKEHIHIVKHIASQSSKKSKQEQKLTASIQKLSSENVYAANALVEVSLLGDSPKTYEYSLTAAKGNSMQEHKWDLHLESETEPRMVCVSGNVKLPVGGEAQQKFIYKNVIGFGSNCKEYFINVDGSTLTRKVAVGEEKKMEATALDQGELKITTSPRLPTVVYSQARLLDSSLKGLLFKYISGLPTIHHNAESSTLIKLDFTLYRNIRIPSWARHLLPISTSRLMIEHSFKSIIGSPSISGYKIKKGTTPNLVGVNHRGVKPVQQKLMKHAILIQAGKTCFSKGLVAECANNAVVRETRQQQEVEFTCLDSGRRDIQDLVRKAMEGTKINRLNNMKTSFVRPVLVPTECGVDY